MLDDVLVASPCSIELPAGCGKTQTITRLALELAETGKRALILTHTHAGVDALRKRFKRLGLPSSAYSVRTLDSWCFDLIGHFPQLSGIEVAEEPVWTESRRYHMAGAQTLRATSLDRMLRASYGLVIVDEYQDCQLWQHELVKQIGASVPLCVLGDRMQGLFFFNDASPVIWERDVLPHFPDFPVEQIPWRWQNTNPELGAWLLDLRESLLAGRPVDMRDGPLALITEADVRTAAWAMPRHPERTAILKKWPSDCAILALQLGGSFTMIEELEGKHLLRFAEQFEFPEGLAAATVEFAVSCAFGVADTFDAASRRTLADGRLLAGARFDPVPTQTQAINRLLADSSVDAVAEALREIARLDTFRLYRREAWFGVLEALRLCQASVELTPRDAVVATRNQLRVRGRYPESRIVARPLLVKGLEFDNVLVAGMSGYDAHEIYVCLTRGSATLTVASNNPVIHASRPYAAN